MNVHKNDLVVVLRTISDDKPLREFSLEPNKDDIVTRARNVYIPNETEYLFHFKNYKPVRRRIEVEIDGTSIGSWILDGGTKEKPYEVRLERYQDEARRFKTASVDSPNVADPGSSDNGRIRITAFEEYQNLSGGYGGWTIVPAQIAPQPWPSYPPLQPMWGGPYIGTPMIGSITTSTHDGNWQTASLRSGIHDGAPCAYTAQISQLNCSVQPQSAPIAEKPREKLATVAGSVSQQRFTTAIWCGDNNFSKTVFEFYLIAKTETKADVKFCPGCGQKKPAKAKFCPHCGTPLV